LGFTGFVPEEDVHSMTKRTIMVMIIFRHKLTWPWAEEQLKNY